MFLPSIALGELYYGARKSVQVAANVRRVDELAGRSSVLVCDEETARHYGVIKDILRAKGRPLPENDIWVAATAMQHSLSLVTRDAHFSEIASLTVVVW